MVKHIQRMKGFGLLITGLLTLGPAVYAGTPLRLEDLTQLAIQHNKDLNAAR